MTRIAFIGLGIMGAPMAANLVAAGHEVIGYNRSRPAVDRLVEAGGKGAGSLAEAIEGAAVVITMLPDSPDVEAVMLGEDGVLAHVKPGVLHIDTSSIAPAAARTVIAAAAEAGVDSVDAPVSGGEQAAIEGTLSIMVGGEADHFEAARPILEVLGATIVHVGPAGSGSTVKAANQLIVAGTIQLVAEALVFLEAYEVDTEAAVKVLAGGLAGNRILDRKAGGMIARSFAPGFRVDLHHKDLGIVLDAARAAGVATPAAALVGQLMGA
ncbi:MAG: NAD(P)-dependent oxidoreductase, partial [Propionibacteriaceae bacterium]